MSLPPLALFFVQLGVTLAVSQLVAHALRRAGQPAVIAEIVAGVLLGPTLFGAIAPGAFAWLFPKPSLVALKLFADAGIVLFMFTVGLRLDPAMLRGKGHVATAISHAGIAVPFVLGLTIAAPLWRAFGAGTALLPFALFVGTALSITAFPVLARILVERGMSDTPLGALVLTCAAVDDVTAWILLAVVTSIASSGTAATALPMLGMLALFAAVMLLGVPRLLGRWRDTNVLPIVVVAIAAAIAETIGIHAVFGAFLAGVSAPADRQWRDEACARVAPLAGVLLPLFFFFSGLRTDLRLLFDRTTIVATIAVLVVGTAGKLGGGMLAARLFRLPWHDAFQIGVLMNTRGLMELVALNVGYELGLVSAPLFSVFVVLALTTTFAAGPLLSLGQRMPSQAPVRGITSPPPAHS